MNGKVVIILPLLFSTAYAEELGIDKKYRAITSLSISSDGEKYDLKVGSQSKFIVIDNDDDDKYAIKFINAYPYARNVPGGDQPTMKYKINEADIYFLRKKEVQGVPIESKVQPSFGGLTSGPLIVPFKYRLNDESISGDTTLGYYAGWGFDTNFWGASHTYVTFTPFISAGVTQVAVAVESSNGSKQTDSESGFTWAIGMLVNNWDRVNIGIVYGQDRIGDSNWEHEGQGWLSVSVGWEI